MQGILEKNMNVIAPFFLRARHWQLFLLFVGAGIVGEVALTISMITMAGTTQDFGKISLVFGGVMTIFMLSFLAWFWSMGAFLNSIVQPGLRLKMVFFRFALIYPALYIFVFMAAFQSTKPLLLAILFPLHFFAMFCMFYNLHFVSKTLVLAETNKPALFYDYAGPFFMMWFFPIGIWFTQPRINRLYLQPELPSISIAPEVLSPPEDMAAYAGFWLRFAAALIDASIMFFPFCFVGFVMVVIFRLASAGKGYDLTLVAFIAWCAVTIAMALSYFAFLERSAWQATFGKIAVRLYVTDIGGRRLTLSRAAGRTLAKCLSILSLGVGYLMCGFTKKKQALHDKLANCLVLRRPSR
ncbi:MAG: RDD family protein [Candidatus Acidiferrum sp.]